MTESYKEKIIRLSKMYDVPRNIGPEQPVETCDEDDEESEQ